MKQFKVLKPYSCELSNYPKYIPWDMLNEDQAKRNHSQTLTRLNERGGMCVTEILDNIKRQRSKFSSRETQADVDELNQLVESFQPQS